MVAAISRVLLPPSILLVGLAVCRLFVIEPQQAAVALPRNEPIKIAPRLDDPRVVTNAQLLEVLRRVKPPTGPANTNQYVHALRLWGAAADFGDPAIPSGRELRDYFLNDADFRRLAGNLAPPLFCRGRDGIEVRSYDDLLTDRQTSSYHADDLVATLAEIGVPLDTHLRMREGEATVGDLLSTALSRFHLEQLEYEWTAIAYGRYVFPQPSWRNKYGEKIDADALVAEIVSHPPQMGPCNGLHRLEALTVLYRADEQFHALSTRSRQKMQRYMQQTGELLVAAQSEEGYWSREWPRGHAGRPDLKRPAQANESTETAGPLAPTLHDKLLVTGHHLEWLALAPLEVQPPRQTIVRAGQWLARALVEMDEKDLREAYGPYTHAARALCLWRGMEAWEAWQLLGGQARALAVSTSLPSEPIPD
jgi:hypothetical protein